MIIFFIWAIHHSSTVILHQWYRWYRKHSAVGDRGQPGTRTANRDEQLGFLGYSSILFQSKRASSESPREIILSAIKYSSPNEGIPAIRREEKECLPPAKSTFLGDGVNFWAKKWRGSCWMNWEESVDSCKCGWLPFASQSHPPQPDVC